MLTQIFDLEFFNSLFFVLCGLQLSFEMVPLLQSNEGKWVLIRGFVSKKYRQLMTLLCAFVLLNASVLTRFSEKLFWKNHTFMETRFCTFSWRLSLLTLNNYAHHNQMCIEPSWILSAELHLTVGGLFVLYLLTKFPKWRNIIAGTAVGASFIVVSSLIYVNKLNPLANVTPE